MNEYLFLVVLPAMDMGALALQVLFPIGIILKSLAQEERYPPTPVTINRYANILLIVGILAFIAVLLLPDKDEACALYAKPSALCQTQT